MQQSFSIPYYAVVFTAIPSEDQGGYEEMALRVRAEAEKVHGYLGMDTATEDIEITVTYWQHLDAVEAWRHNVRHMEAKHLGSTRWFEAHRVRICKVEEEY